MSYLLDKKTQRRQFFKIGISVITLLVLFYFRSGVFNGLSYVSQGIFRPVLVISQNIGGKLGSLGSYFVSKNSLYLQNQDLQSKLNEQEAQMSNYGLLVADNENLKEILNRKNEKISLVLAVILSKPNQSLYDTLVIDVGANKGIKVGEVVFAKGNVPLGRISEVYATSSKVILFSNAGEKTQIVVPPKNVYMEVVGRGGGNFELTMPLGFTPVKGDEVVLPGINSYVLATIETVISDPRDSFVKVLLVSPVNIQELKFVEVESGAK